MAKVSVLVITYNQAHLVRETVASCLAQDYDDFEVVVADDGSTDGTADVLRELERANPERIRLVLNPVNRGITANCNSGLERCSGEYLALMGGDDLLLPTKLSRQVAAFEEEPELVLSYHPTRVLRDGVLAEVVGHRPKDIVLDQLDMISRFGAEMSGPATMIATAAIPPGGFRAELGTASDWMFFIDVAASGSVRRIDEPLALYRQHAGNVGKRYFSYSDDFLHTLVLTRELYGSRPGVVRATRAGGRRFLLGIIYRAAEQGRPDLARGYARELSQYAPAPLALLLRGVLAIPGIGRLFAALRSVLKRLV